MLNNPHLRFLLVLLAALLLWVAANLAVTEKATAADFYEPPCEVKNPPDPPRLNEDIVIGAIANRCKAPVWKLGAFGCLQVKRIVKKDDRIEGNGWKNVWCEAAEKRFVTALTLYVDHRVSILMPELKYHFVWRVQGNVWVDYDPAPGVGEYSSQVVTSVFVPLGARP